MPPPAQKKKADTAALQSPFMRIPRLPVDVARDLLDLGLREIYELHGRSPEALLADLRKLKPATPPDRLAWFRLAVYFAETPAPERDKLHPAAWL
ncbi:MAG: helix-hairpin-helix domain-containing protein [Opitutales bacterium]